MKKANATSTANQANTNNTILNEKEVNTMTINEMLKNEHTTTTTTAKGNTTEKRVILKQSDFIAVYGKEDGRAIKKGYTARMRELSGAISKYINNDINIADAVKKLQAVYDYLHTSCNVDKITAQKLDIKYIINDFSRVTVKDGEIIKIDKLESGLQKSVEDCVYMHLNGKRPQVVTLEKRHEMQAEKREKAKAQKQTTKKAK